MGAVTDVLALLDKTPIWKRLTETPDRLEGLEKRVAELEALLAKAPGDACGACGERAMRRVTVGRRLGDRDAYRFDIWKCEKCGRNDERKVSL